MEHGNSLQPALNHPVMYNVSFLRLSVNAIYLVISPLQVIGAATNPRSCP